ncbi:CHAT domain-containing tetratricopeptide repeat protein [Phycicoccus avicenniae]|uniref:tetratricopeptide repeat protein n=1 Tax=Phycicoccus avicenniae TaxID=2828860 RepID=UPI003D2AF4B3
MTDSSQRLYRDWVAVPDRDTGPWLVECPEEPVTIALRSRWHYLRQLAARPAVAPDHRVDVGMWKREVDLEDEADRALVTHDLDVAEDRFTTMRRHASHPLVEVQALIGLGDVAREHDQTDRARKLYEEALSAASDLNFRFGALRARLPLVYLTRRGGSARQMLALAQDCESDARALGDAIYTANAQIAQGEALELVGEHDRAASVLWEAFSYFEKHGNDVGMAGAGIRLADVHRRREDADAIIAVARQVADAALRVGAVQEAVDVHDLLAFAHTANGDYEEALRACERGLAMAGTALPRSTAHLHISQGTALRHNGQPDDAAHAFVAALDYFEDRTDDEWMVSYCLSHLADCAADLDETDQAVQLHLHATEQTEVVRARQDRPEWQREYRARFDDIYRRALTYICQANVPEAFATVFERLWGRRLAGITAGLTFRPQDDPALLAQLIARTDQARLKDPLNRDAPKRAVRALGRTALSGALPDQYADNMAGPLAAAYRTVSTDEARQLLAAVNTEVALVLMCEVPARPGQIACLFKAPGHPATVTLVELPEATKAALDQWTSPWPTDATAADLHALAPLLAAPLAQLPTGTGIQLVPLERLWSIPWAALPVNGTPLGMAHPLMIVPSLTLAAHHGPLPAAVPDDGKVFAHIGGDVHVHDLAGLAPATNRATAGASAREAALSGDLDTLVVVAHGRLTRGVGHYLELGDDVLLTPADMFTATVPRSVALLACWGAHTMEPNTGEPLTLGTLALARGSRQVLTTISELGDSRLARAVVNDTLYRARTQPWAAALLWTLQRRREELTAAPLSDWAPLATLGAW